MTELRVASCELRLRAEAATSCHALSCCHATASASTQEQQNLAADHMRSRLWILFIKAILWPGKARLT